MIEHNNSHAFHVIFFIIIVNVDYVIGDTKNFN